MTIAVGDKIPDVKLHHMTDNGPSEITTSEIFDGKKVLLFALARCLYAHLLQFSSSRICRKSRRNQGRKESTQSHVFPSMMYS